MTLRRDRDTMQKRLKDVEEEMGRNGRRSHPADLGFSESVVF